MIERLLCFCLSVSQGFFKLSKGLDSVTASLGICKGEIAVVGSLGLFFFFVKSGPRGLKFQMRRLTLLRFPVETSK